LVLIRVARASLSHVNETDQIERATGYRTKNLTTAFEYDPYLTRPGVDAREVEEDASRAPRRALWKYGLDGQVEQPMEESL
jgi:hypothetical protein